MDAEERIRIYHALRQAIASLERLRDDVIGGEFDGEVNYDLGSYRGEHVRIEWVPASTQEGEAR